MNLKLSALAAAALMAAGSAHADIALPSSGDGSLFFSLWDENGSYTFDMNTLISQFETKIAEGGPVHMVWDLSADSVLGAFLASADLATLRWNIVAADGVGARRLLTTYTEPKADPTQTNDVMRSAVGYVEDFQIYVNENLPDDDSAASIAVNSASQAWAGKEIFSDTLGSLLNFSNAAGVNGMMGFMRIDAKATGIANSLYNTYLDDGVAVTALYGDDNMLYLTAQPVPEADTWAMMLAGLGLVGMMARRRTA